MTGILLMSQQDTDRVNILAQVHQGMLTVAHAAATLSLSERPVYRLLQRYRREGDRGVMHRLRGRPSNRGYPRQLCTTVVRLYWQQYRDYGPTLFSEMHLQYHSIDVDHETVRRWLDDSLHIFSGVTDLSFTVLRSQPSLNLDTTRNRHQHIPENQKPSVETDSENKA